VYSFLLDIIRSVAARVAHGYIALGYGLDVPEFESRQGLGLFLLTTASRLALGPNQPPIQRQWEPEALPVEEKWPGLEADHSRPSSAEVKNAWSYSSTLSYVFIA
jgi:hypothetical protein